MRNDALVCERSQDRLGGRGQSAAGCLFKEIRAAALTYSTYLSIVFHPDDGGKTCRAASGRRTTARCLDRCPRTLFDRRVSLCELEIAFSWMKKKKCCFPCQHLHRPPHLLFAFRATGTWTYLVLWLTRYPQGRRHGRLSAAYFPIAVMRSLSQVPSRPPTFPLYKARRPGSVTAPWGKLWNRMAGLVSGRADSAVRLPLIPYYPASPSFFSPFLITVSLRPPSFIVALPVPGHSLSGSAREKDLFLRGHKEESVF